MTGHREATTSEDSAGSESRLAGFRQALDQLRIKLTTPYAFLALAVAFAATYLVSDLLVGVLEDRFQNALLDAAHQAADTVVRVEREQLAVWRAVAYTEGFAEAVAAGDAQAATGLALPLVLNAKLDCLDVVDASGTGLVGLHHVPGGGLTDYTLEPGQGYASWPLVARVLAGQADERGDKYADLVQTEWGWVFYTSGPIKQGERVVGALLVGTYLDGLVTRLSNAALARVSVFTQPGPPTVTTLAPEEPGALALDAATYTRTLERQAQEITHREVEVAGRGYGEVAGPFEARYGSDLGVMTVALPLSFLSLIHI